MEGSEPKILFGNLLGFPPISADGRIKTKQFLNAAREIVSLIGKFIKGIIYYIYFCKMHFAHFVCMSNFLKK